ncbi:MAG: hypothetical protein AAF557_12430 [Pseudomonadota bacterium]
MYENAFFVFRPRPSEIPDLLDEANTVRQKYGIALAAQGRIVGGSAIGGSRSRRPDVQRLFRVSVPRFTQELRASLIEAQVPVRLSKDNRFYQYRDFVHREIARRIHLERGLSRQINSQLTEIAAYDPEFDAAIVLAIAGRESGGNAFSTSTQKINSFNAGGLDQFGNPSATQDVPDFVPCNYGTAWDIAWLNSGIRNTQGERCPPRHTEGRQQSPRQGWYYPMMIPRNELLIAYGAFIAGARKRAIDRVGQQRFDSLDIDQKRFFTALAFGQISSVNRLLSNIGSSSTASEFASAVANIMASDQSSHPLRREHAFVVAASAAATADLIHRHLIDPVQRQRECLFSSRFHNTPDLANEAIWTLDGDLFGSQFNRTLRTHIPGAYTPTMSVDGSRHTLHFKRAEAQLEAGWDDFRLNTQSDTYISLSGHARMRFSIARSLIERRSVICFCEGAPTVSSRHIINGQDGNVHRLNVHDRLYRGLYISAFHQDRLPRIGMPFQCLGNTMYWDEEDGTYGPRQRMQYRRAN